MTHAYSLSRVCVYVLGPGTGQGLNTRGSCPHGAEATQGERNKLMIKPINACLQTVKNATKEKGTVLQRTAR